MMRLRELTVAIMLHTSSRRMLTLMQENVHWWFKLGDDRT